MYHDERLCSANFADGAYDAVCATCYADIVATITEDYPFTPKVDAEYRVRVVVGDALYRLAKTFARLAQSTESLSTRAYPQA